MTRVLILLLAVMVSAPAFGRGKHGSNLNAKDPSTDFSAHFDEEVKYDRAHPKPDDSDASDPDPAPAPTPKKRRSSHRRKKKSAPPSQDESL
jgi:hypothetical protein